jgi:hypothetical protein
MVRVKTCFAALAIIRDAETNGISAFNIIENLTAVGIPFFMQSAYFFVLWEHDPDDPPRVPGVFTITSGDLELSRTEISVDFGNTPRHRTVVNVSGLVVPRSGQLAFRVTLENQVQAEYVVDVVVPPPGVQVRPGNAVP